MFPPFDFLAPWVIAMGIIIAVFFILLLYWLIFEFNHAPTIEDQEDLQESEIRKQKNKTMKKTILLIIGVLAFGLLTVQAQTFTNVTTDAKGNITTTIGSSIPGNPFDLPVTAAPASTGSIFSGLGNLLSLGGGTNAWDGATNWVAIPYFVHDFTTKNNGVGIAVLYSVTPNFWAGLRAQKINGQQNTAGVQGQLQISRKVGPVMMTPFIDSSVGTGVSALYGTIGSGLLVNFTHFKVGQRAILEIGLLANYEHYVNGASNSSLASNGNTGEIGPLLHLSF